MVYKGHLQITTLPVPDKKCTFMLCFWIKKCQKAISTYWQSLINVFLIKHTACMRTWCCPRIWQKIDSLHESQVSIWIGSGTLENISADILCTPSSLPKRMRAKGKDKEEKEKLFEKSAKAVRNRQKCTSALCSISMSTATVHKKMNAMLMFNVLHHSYTVKTAYNVAICPRGKWLYMCLILSKFIVKGRIGAWIQQLYSRINFISGDFISGFYCIL